MYSYDRQALDLGTTIEKYQQHLDAARKELLRARAIAQKVVRQPQISYDKGVDWDEALKGFSRIEDELDAL